MKNRALLLFVTMAAAAALCVPQLAFAEGTDDASGAGGTSAGTAVVAATGASAGSASGAASGDDGEDAGQNAAADAAGTGGSGVSANAADGADSDNGSAGTQTVSPAGAATSAADAGDAGAPSVAAGNGDADAVGGGDADAAGGSDEGSAGSPTGAVADADAASANAGGTAGVGVKPSAGAAAASVATDTATDAATATTAGADAAATATASPATAAATASAVTATATAKRAAAKKAAAPTLKSGWYTVKSRLGTSYAVYVKDLSTKDGAKLVLKKGSTSVGFAFLVKKSGSYYRIYLGIAKSKLVEVKSTASGGFAVDARAKAGSAGLFTAVYDQAAGGYSFVNVATGRALAVSGGVAKAGAKISAKAREDGSAAQAFLLKDRGGLVAQNVYIIKSTQKGKRALTAANSKGRFYQYIASTDQKWYVSPVAGKKNVYTIESITTGKKLVGAKNKQVKVKKASAANANAWWTPAYSKGGIVWKNYSNKKPLSTAGKKCAEGSKAMNKKQGTSSSRVFKMSVATVLESGVYVLQSNANAGYVLAVPNSSKAAGAAVQVKKTSNGNNQKWIYDAGAHTFTNVNSGLVLQAGGATAGSGLSQAKSTGAKTQQWTVQYAGAGKYRLVSKAKSTLVATAAAASDGAATALQANAGKKLQKWNVVATEFTVSPKGFKLIKDIVNWGHGSLDADYICIHETANPGATAKNHRDLWAGNSYYADYAVHYTLDWTGNCYYCVPENRLCWQVGNGNSHVIGIELCHATNKSDFNKVWNGGVQWAAWELAKHGWGVDRLLSHNECRVKWGGTDHTDPDGYFESFGKTWKQFKAAVKKALATY